MNRVILVLSDGMRYDTAVAAMGFLGHMVEIKQASLYKVFGDLPSFSRPMYETIHTGLPSSEHGVVSNSVVRLSTKANIFQLVKDAGKVTAAAAYSWFSELYNRVPYNPVDDKEVDDENLSIQHGRFYLQDDYPDAELFTTAATLVRRFSPDYLLIHPMGMDYFGEIYGPDSSQYRNQAIRQDAILAPFIVEWNERGYTILFTSDHGITKDRTHGGTTPAAREVPLFLIRPDVEEFGDTKETISQLQIAPTICKILDILIPGGMKHPPVI